MNSSEPTPNTNEIEQIKKQIKIFDNLEDYVYDVLDEIMSLKIRNKHKKAKSELVEFAKSNRELYSFLTVILNQDPDHMEKIKEQVNDDKYEQYLMISEKYSRLTAEFNAVFMQTQLNRMNPVSGFDSQSGYSEMSQEPMVEFQLSSGDISVLHSRIAVSTMVYLASAFIQSSIESLNLVDEQELVIGSEEVDHLKESSEQLEEKINNYQDIVDSL